MFLKYMSITDTAVKFDLGFDGAGPASVLQRLTMHLTGHGASKRIE